MAPAAVSPFLAAVRVFVAVRAFLTQAKERVVQVLDLDLRACACGNVFRRVALFAGERGVLAFERETGLSGMIEAFALQADDGEFFAVMLHMTAHAIGLARGRLVGACMKSGVRVEALANLDVAFEALEGSCARTEVVARGALRNPLQFLMRLRQGAWRNLCCCWNLAHNRYRQCQ